MSRHRELRDRRNIMLFGLFKRDDETTDWERYWGLTKQKLITGEYEWNHLMRRRVKGEWQYRKMTEEEALESFLWDVV